MRPRPAALLPAAVPYIAVVAGLYAARSAWTSIVCYHVGIVAVLTMRGWRPHLGAAWRGWRGVGVAVAAVSVLAGAALYALWPVMDATPAGLAARLGELGLGPVSWVVFAVYYATVHPVLEELFWRGPGGKHPGGEHPGGTHPGGTGPGGEGAGAAPSWGDAAFALYHALVLPWFVGPAWVALACVVLVGAAWVWRLAARRFGGLAVPIVAHAAADAAIVVAVSLVVRGGRG